MDETPNKNPLGRLIPEKNHFLRTNLGRFNLRKFNLAEFSLNKLNLVKRKIKKIDLTRFSFSRFGLSGKKAGVISVVLLVVLVIVGIQVYNTGYDVYINGIPVGTVRSKAEAKDAIAELTQEIGAGYETGDIVVGAALDIKKVKLSDNRLTDKDVLKKNMMKNISIKRPAVTVMIGGSPVLSIMGREQAEKLLEDIKASFIPDGKGIETDRIYIKEKVELLEQAVDINKLMIYEDAYKFLLNGTTEEKVYTVKKGDSLWLISRNNNISVEDLEKANPGISPKRLQIGQKINMIVPKPFLTVVTEEIATYSEKIPFDTDYKQSSEFYKGESIITKYGKYGKKEVTARIIKENGVEVTREILEETVVEEPVTRLVALGIKPPPPRQGTGTFSYPARGRITSGFGWRWGRRHNGIDIALNSGTPVKASDGGTVKFAGNYGGYGLLVIIDHGEGYETYYGHNSKLLVKKGDKVHKGQTVALSGSTGNTTGPHLHFEVRKFGVPVNPIQYLDQ